MRQSGSCSPAYTRGLGKQEVKIFLSWEGARLVSSSVGSPLRTTGTQKGGAGTQGQFYFALSNSFHASLPLLIAPLTVPPGSSPYLEGRKQSFLLSDPHSSCCDETLQVHEC